jgi:hypothetical protein
MLFEVVKENVELFLIGAVIYIVGGQMVSISCRVTMFGMHVQDVVL